ncbi:hypothetical protein BGAL_0457g00030 [Botrytis galanthina]|uniref:Flavin-nucleotide-binding protein n=1 Tax=Botrytis galanthina TaxID=278940 RepID=A0A4S8QM59_9HELO|nr:hypothetical protein BGAL_0457g00030 [Botrytis galanthina]
MADSDAEITMYPKTPRNTVQRYRPRAKYDHRTIHTIINSSPILHVSFHTPSPEDPFPAILPMLGFMGLYDPQNPTEENINEGANLYLHGYVSSRLMRMGKKASEEGEGSEGEEGLPMTVAASCLDGLVLALTPNNHSYNYRSAILQGYGQVVEDVDEKLWAMEKITNTVLTDRWENTRVPPTKTEMTTTQILRITPHTASAKIRRGPPHDDHHDLKDAELKNRVWTGVVPVHTVYGTPIRGEDCDIREVPQHITNFIDAKNKENKQYAIDRAGDEDES